jgi:glutamyl-tRNA synthetase
VTRPVRVRFAPSPTGKLHIGGARTALFNWAYARRHGGVFLLRIEDTDPERSTKEYELAILDGLRWLGIHWQEGPDVGGPHAPYHQSQRIERHKQRARELSAMGRAYPCFCSRERLEELAQRQEAAKERQGYDGLCRRLDAREVARRVAGGEPHTLRFAVPAGATEFHDHIRGPMRFENHEVEDWVMVRSDGNPTYNFVVVCDDIDMQISLIMRGEEHLINTPKQVLLYHAFGAALPEFAHLPLMLGTDKKKLSKRTGDTSLQDYRDKGFPPEAVVNFLCLQGWALSGSQEIFSVEELVANFEIKDVNKAGAVFDIEKFLWMAGEYIRRDSVERVAQRCAPHVVRAGLMSAEELALRADWFRAVVSHEKERIRTYGELPARIEYLFVKDEGLVYGEEAEKNARRHANRLTTLAAFRAWLEPRLAAGADAAALREGVKQFQTEQNLKTPQLLQPLRCALSGHASGPDTFEVILLLGAQRTLRRLELAQERLA